MTPKIFKCGGWQLLNKPQTLFLLLMVFCYPNLLFARQDIDYQQSKLLTFEQVVDERENIQVDQIKKIMLPSAKIWHQPILIKFKNRQSILILTAPTRIVQGEERQLNLYNLSFNHRNQAHLEWVDQFAEGVFDGLYDVFVIEKKRNSDGRFIIAFRMKEQTDDYYYTGGMKGYFYSTALFEAKIINNRIKVYPPDRPWGITALSNCFEGYKGSVYQECTYKTREDIQHVLDE